MYIKVNQSKISGNSKPIIIKYYVDESPTGPYKVGFMSDSIFTYFAGLETFELANRLKELLNDTDVDWSQVSYAYNTPSMIKSRISKTVDFFLKENNLKVASTIEGNDSITTKLEVYEECLKESPYKVDNE